MNVLGAADRYCKESTWKTLAGLKICQLSLGIAVGTVLPRAWKRAAHFVTLAVFFVTCVPLTVKFFRLLGQDDSET